MATYNQIGKGAAFTREKTNEKQPDFGGTVNVMDKEFPLSFSPWSESSQAIINECFSGL